MRTLRLTHEEVDILRRALSVAQNNFIDLWLQQLKQIKTIADMGCEIKGMIIEAGVIRETENQFHNLLLDIENGDKDV